MLILKLHGLTLLWCWQIKHDDMCEAVQRFGEQLVAAGTYLQEESAVQAAQLQTLVSKMECCADISSMAIVRINVGSDTACALVMLHSASVTTPRLVLRCSAGGGVP